MPAYTSGPDQIRDRADRYAREQPAEVLERTQHDVNLSALKAAPGSAPGPHSGWYSDSIGSDPLAGRSDPGVKPEDAK
jgi:hypothetical protein